MIFIDLFLTFLKIGIFTFGGGYAMIALIQNEVVMKHEWMTAQEFTDLVAISQMTPGPIGINTATYAGYTAIMNECNNQLLATAGAITASLAVILLPVILMFVVLRLLQKYTNNPNVNFVFQVLRLVVVGLIASAALVLLSTENFGIPGINLQFIISCVIFSAVFVASFKFKVSPILLICISGMLGLIIYSL